MRIRELLVEYNRAITLKKQGDALLSHAIEYERDQTLTGDQILDQLERGDPTANKMYMLWIIRQYFNKQFRLEDMSRIGEVIAAYHQAKPRLPVEQKDINRMTFYQLEDLVDSWSSETSNSTAASGKYSDVKDLEILYDGPLGLLAIPKTQAASCEIGSGTKWCTSATNDNGFENYNNKGPLYVWIEYPGGLKYQFHFETPEFMDDKNRPLSPEKLEYFRKKNPITRKLFSKKEAEILQDPNPQVVSKYARDIIQGRWPEAEPVIAQDRQAAYHYAEQVIKGRWPEAESVIAQDPWIASNYAQNIIKGRWPEAEPVILQDPQATIYYVWGVIGGRWPEAEPVILQDPQAAMKYAQHVIKGRWPKAEPVILQAPQAACDYAEQVIKGRWPEAEPVIAQDPHAAMKYAQRVIKGRWPKAEPFIAQNLRSESKSHYPLAAYIYAQDMIKGRWLEAEPVIARDPEVAMKYAHYVIKGRWPEAESVIARDPEVAYHYAERVIKGRWPEAESVIAQDPDAAINYAVGVIGGRWPEAEPVIAQDPHAANFYRKWLKTL
jgi:hypothetical protein